MIQNKSPWIHQLDSNRKTETLSTDIHTDIAIIGAGIAGISSAFFLLKHTDKNIALIEKGRLAHGATGHNAGIVVSWFERPFADIVSEFGLSLAIEGKRSVDSAWGLLDEMYQEAELSIPFSCFTGYDGFASLTDIVEYMETNLLFMEGGEEKTKILIAEEAEILSQIPEKYIGLYEIIPHQKILSLLETTDTSYIALAGYKFGTINSALFCQEIIAFLLKKYPQRFSLYEHTNIRKVVLKKDRAILDAEKHTITAGRVILCTNGFEYFSILNETGLEINTRFHHSISGVVGYMSGYLEKTTKPPAAFCYVPQKENGVPEKESVPYFYLSRRAYERGTEQRDLVSIGGHDAPIDDRHKYSTHDEYPEHIYKEIIDFVEKKNGSQEKMELPFTWHGLMGYTPNMIRLVGTEPKNPVLLYNLGCNGVGILPSIFGGKRISDILSGKKSAPSIFDPKDH